MNLVEARSVLGISPESSWGDVRAAYRKHIGAAHPDRAGDDGLEDAVRINAAYKELSLANDEGRLNDSVVVPPPRTPPTAPQTANAPHLVDLTDRGVRFLDDSTLVFDTLPTETFLRLVEAGHALGEISYVDRSAAILEIMVRLSDGTPASLVFSLQWRAHDATCEAFATLEALDRAERLDVSGVLEQLLQFIPAAD